MTTLDNFVPKFSWHFIATRFVREVPEIDSKEMKKNCAFFLDSVTKGCYGNCENLYRECEIRSMGYKYIPDNFVKLLVRPEGMDYVTRYLPGCLEDYTPAKIDKWVREFDGAACWCVKPEMRWVSNEEN